MSLVEELRKQKRDTHDSSPAWVTGVIGHVADTRDPERQQRIKVVIPSIDEDEIYDEWVRPFAHCLGAGFGSAFVPPRGSEVVLFGQLGQKYNLFYASLYNEEMRQPDALDDENNVGYNVPGSFSIIAALLAKIQAQNIQLIAEQLARVTGQNVEMIATSLAKLQGQNVQISGTTITVQADGSISIGASGDIAVNAAGNLTLQGRVVNKVGPAI